MKYLSLAIIVFLYGCAPKQEQAGTPPPQALPVISINAASVTTSLDYPASIEGKVNVEIRPQVDGYLDKIFVDEGAFVTAGKPLFKINEQPYREQLNSANAALHSAEASVINAQLEIDKLTPLVQNKVVSDIQLKTAKAAYSVAAANVEQAKAQVAAARINLGYTLIKAPVSGYIGRLPKKQGSLVSRTDPQALTNLSDVHEVLAYFSFGENDFISFKQQYPGNTLEEKLKSLPDVLLVLADNTVYQEKGRIDIIDGQFDKNTGAITVRAKFPNTKGLLRSGNTGKIRLSLKHNNALLVPQSATVEMQDKVFVYAVGKDNKVSKQPVTVGGKMVLITW
ncbi:efflux RND transporter periplasmic adaptor subunit [Pseudarcicella hirudinis]|uniref:efflux RND transporter periplasmic adaptor subunit n=1 Tax=Pseudarcicella hirudinis TaxID=1079859 RepID=UPI0035ECD29E